MLDQQQESGSLNERSLAALSRVITLSQDQFVLVLVRCNYAQIRDRMAQALQARLPFPIYSLTLPESAKTLYTTIQTAISEYSKDEEAAHLSPTDPTLLSQPSDSAGVVLSPHALMIFGLENVQDLDQVLVATNIVREELRKQFQFPLVLWLNDEVLRKLERLAPDLSSWAGNAIIEFEMAIPELVQSLKHHSDRLFNSVLSWGDEQFWASWQIPPPNSLRPNELKFAIEDLQNNQYAIDPELQAGLDFLLGQSAHSQGEMETARELYERSLAFWVQHLGEEEAQKHKAEGRGQETEGKSQEPELSQIPPSLPAQPVSLASPQSQTSAPIPLSPPFPPPPSPPSPLPPIPYLERAACLLFYLGLWWRSYAVLQRAAYRNACLQAQHHFQRSLALFSQENRQDLVSRFISAQAETLQKLENWDELEQIAKQSLVLHKLYKDRVREARDRGFLAEVAIARSQWQIARQQVELALQILDAAEAELQADPYPAEPQLEVSLELAHRYHYGWYLLLLAKAEQELGNLDAAIGNLEVARDRSHPQDDPPLYIQILRKLRDAYFEKGEYRLAFRTRQARRLIEHQYGYRAFVGALRLQPQDFGMESPFPLPAQIDQQRLLIQELEASGRQKDLNILVTRLSQAQHKLIVIHGPSGVGKSSMLNAGLHPLLQEHPIEGRIPLPLLFDFYNDWELSLRRVLKNHELISPDLATYPTIYPPTHPSAPSPPSSPSPVHGQSTHTLWSDLKEVTEQNYLPILLLDQFEEFFFTYATIRERLPFYRFLGECLKLPFVKVVLSIREDYLHYLLEFQRYADLDIINDDILGKQIRYPLGDLTPQDAKAVIISLTNRAQFYLPDDLVDALVQELAGELGEVRPIELQVVGAQLQAEGIDTLAEYRQKGPKERLVQRSLEDVIQDCGPENEDLAQIILFLLTSENGTRPLKTRDDLESDLVDLGLTHAIANLDLVLEVLLGSGLIFLIPDSPADCYQLVHDYLVGFIRQEQESEVARLQAELQQERGQRRNAEDRLQAELQQRLQAEEQLRLTLSSQMQSLKRQLQRSQLSFQFAVLTLMLFGLIVSILWQNK